METISSFLNFAFVCFVALFPLVNPIGTALVFQVVSAAWELDLWGRIRRLDESSRAQFLATEEAQRGVTMSLVSAVAQSYFELLALDLELDIAQRTTNAFGQTATIFRVRLDQGVASRLEWVRAQAALTASAAIVPDIERAIALKEDEINVLLEQPPGNDAKKRPSRIKFRS
jgi:outer membrane protein, multidrug efflux system